MNSYINLVSTYAKAHKKKNRLTMVCIALSVMLMTAIFGMADMSLQSQTEEAINRYGNWHVIFSSISDDTAEEIAAREDVDISSWLGIVDGITYQEKELIVQSSSDKLSEQMNMTVTEGYYPVTAQEALLDRSGLEEYGLSIGDMIEVAFPDGETRQYTITGTYEDYSTLKGSDAHGLQLSTEGMRSLPAELYSKYYYVQFKDNTNINSAIADIQTKYGFSDDQISTNVMLLGLMGQSNDTTMLEIYLTAGILFVLVSLASMFMIASSFNMSILSRTQFFGLLRCLGATKKQVKRYIRREGLLYCAKAIPFGLLAGTIVQWAAMFVLNKLNSQYLPVMPSYQISWIGVGAGAMIGVLVVMIASNSPAKRAAKVSPQVAVTGNINQTNSQTLGKASNTNLFHVDTAMGLRHAFSNKKSMVLISGSFATSIILFLCFSVLITFMNHALSPLKSYSPDLSIVGAQEDVLLEPSLMKEIRTLSGVDEVYGRMYLTDILASANGDTNTVKMISYDLPQFEWAKDVLISGSIDSVQSGSSVLVYYGYMQDNNWSIGDTITLTIDGKVHEVQVGGIVSDVPVDAENSEWIVFCSESVFTSLTGITDYKVIDVQTNTDVSEQVRNLLTSDMKLLDYQQHNNEVRTGYYAVAVFVYGFLMVIAFVALFNIINTINSSVSSRMNNYGVMRAVGMSGKQLKKIITAEAAAYAITGSIAGSILGLWLHRLFYGILVTPNWGAVWQPPLVVLAAIILATLLTTFLAIISPAKEIERMSIVNIVNAG